MPATWNDPTATWNDATALWNDGASSPIPTPRIITSPYLPPDMNPGVTVSSYATSISSASGNFCTIGAIGSVQSPMAYILVAYKVVTGSGITAGTLTLQTLDGDGQWRALAAAAQPITSALGANTTYSGSLTIGPIRGIRWALSGLTGGAIVYMDLLATVQ